MQYRVESSRTALLVKENWPAQIKNVENERQIQFTGRMNRSLTDEQLMLKYAKGDLAAFEALYEKHKGALYRFCLRHFSSPAMAEDCFQEIWIKLINHRQKYLPKALFSTYLYRVAQNQVIDTWRKYKKHQQDYEFEETSPSISEYAVTEHSAYASGNEKSDRAELLREAIAQLPIDQKSAILLKIDGGFSLEEIGLILDCGRETVKSKLRYANAKLKSIIEGLS